MRRIPRPQRAIDHSLSISTLIQHRLLPPSCLRAALPHPHLRTASACFSTTPTFNFLLGGKQDKKKHQAFVRRWQKRLLGDSEPIGAHVDPYDPTSPVRIAPEEQGEEVEVLDEDENKPRNKPRNREGGRTLSRSQRKKLRSKEYVLQRLGQQQYKEATHGPLLHVGGKEWIEHGEEIDMAKEFEKLTLRTYTPMTQSMADQIEKWTGTFYTLRDENLMMAQTFDGATGKPYTDFSFGRAGRVRNPEILRESFHQAVVEIYALKQAGKELDMAKQANRGIYESPSWIHNVKLQRNGEGEFELSFPPEQSLETLIEKMQRVPEYAPPVPQKIIEEVVEEELSADEGEPLAPKAVDPPPPPPIMDPATPAFKRAALVKDDQDKPKFDFMSNRPVPRVPRPEPVKPAEPVAEDVEKVREVVIEEPVAAPEPPPATAAIDFDSAFATSTSVINELRLDVLDFAACSAEQKVSAIREALRNSMTSLSSQTVLRVEKPDVEVKWHHVPLPDVHMKFALSKRIIQLTGHYISDPQLTSAKTLGDLYHHVCGVANPTPSDVYTYIHVEGARLNRLKKQAGAKVKVHAGELLKAGNVEILKRKASKPEKRRKIGLAKVISRKLVAKRLVPGKDGKWVGASPRVRAEKGQGRRVEMLRKTFELKEFEYN